MFYTIQPVFIVLIVLLSLLCVAGIVLLAVETKKRIVTKYTIENGKITKGVDSFKGTKIVYFSDIHIGKYMKKEDLKQNILSLRELNADLYIFGGDLIGKKPYKYFTSEEISRCFAPLADKCCIAVFGNHEFKKEKNMNDEYKYSLFKAMGFIILNNEEFIFNDKIKIYGMMENIYHQPVLPQKHYDLILSHQGDIIDKVDEGIMLSGHTHGGQMIIPHFPIYYRPKNGKKYRYGLYKFENKSLVVSSGLGYGGLKLRLFVPSEIIEIDFR